MKYVSSLKIHVLNVQVHVEALLVYLSSNGYCGFNWGDYISPSKSDPRQQSNKTIKIDVYFTQVLLLLLLLCLFVSVQAISVNIQPGSPAPVNGSAIVTELAAQLAANLDEVANAVRVSWQGLLKGWKDGWQSFIERVGGTVISPPPIPQEKSPPPRIYRY